MTCCLMTGEKRLGTEKRTNILGGEYCKGGQHPPRIFYDFRMEISFTNHVNNKLSGQKLHNFLIIIDDESDF